MAKIQAGFYDKESGKRKIQTNAGQTFTMDELRKFIETEKIKPLDLFSEDVLFADPGVKKEIELRTNFELEERDRESEEDAKAADKETKEKALRAEREKKKEEQEKENDNDDASFIPGDEPEESSSDDDSDASYIPD